MSVGFKLEHRLSRIWRVVLVLPFAAIITCVGDQSPITDPSQSVAHGSTATISPTTVVAPSAPVELLREDFDSAGFGSRGWYDYRVDPILTDTTHAPGSTRALEVHFAAGAQTPPWVAARHLFTPSPSVYVSYWVRYSANWVGSGQPYHPHEFQIMSDLDGDYDGLSNGWMEAYIEQNYQNGGKPRLSIQDSKAINTNYGTPPIDLTKVTEDRSVGGCNGLLESNVTTSCFSFPPWYNDKEINAPNVWFQPQPGPGYKSNWNHVEAYFQINSIVNGIGQADGVAQYWFNGTLVLDRHDLLFRTGARPTINFKQFVIAPYIGDGSPVDQTMWVDNLVVATAPASSSPPPPPPPPATNPGMVGDLSVSSSTDSVATLSFTEVTDGTGQPASYDVRYAAGTISWGSATSVSQGTCATPVAGTAIGAARTCTVSGLKPSTAYQFQLVAFRGTMNQNAVYGGLSNVASGTTTATIAPVATVSVSPATVTLKIGTTQQYIATLRDASGAVLTGRAVAWSSSNPLLATVNSSGLATALAAGTVTITATSESKSGSAALTVTVPKPGRVKDLAVSSHTDTSLTIAFTEVGDGTGHPASYDVRFAPGTISWGSATSVTQGTCATPLAGTTIGATKTCTILGLLASTAYQVQLVAFRGTMNVNAVYGGLSNVAGAATDSDPPPAPPPPPPPVPPPPPPAPPPPAPPPAPSGLWPNEPSGFTAVTERSFDSPAEAGWGAYGPLAIVSDPSAPKSPGGVGQVTFPAGFTGGYEPSFTAIDGFNGQGYTQFYVSFWVKISDNWQGHSSGVNKIGFVWLHGDPVVFFVPTGVGSGPLEPMIWLQNTPGGGARLPANVNNVEFTRGVWHRWEALLIVNTGDLANGEAHWWIDGVKVGEYKNIEFGTSAQSKYWGDELSWRPIWGGVDDAVTQTMYMWMDHYYASGR